MSEKDDDEDLNIIIPQHVTDQMESDPELAEGLREMFALMRQAYAAVKAGQYASFDDAMEALTGNRPEKIAELDDMDEAEVIKAFVETEDDDK